MRLRMAEAPGVKGSLVPLIDVVLNVLIYFVLVSAVGQFSSLQLVEPANDQVDASSSDAQPTEWVNVKGGGIVEVGGKDIDDAQLVDVLRALPAKGVAAILVKVERQANVQDFVRVLDAAQGAHLQVLTMSGVN